jgi:hypothetical protein
MPSLQAPTAYAAKTNTISSTALAISHASWSWTAGHLTDADVAVISCNTNGVLITWDGTTPTTTLGHYLAAAANPLVIKGNANIQNLKFIRLSSDSVVTVHLEKYG